MRQGPEEDSSHVLVMRSASSRGSEEVTMAASRGSKKGNRNAVGEASASVHSATLAGKDCGFCSKWDGKS